MKVEVISDETLAKNQVKIHAVDGLGIGYTSVFNMRRGRVRELRSTRRASNAKTFWPEKVCRVMYGAACRYLFAKRV